MTSIFSTVRNAALIAIALGSFAGGALPVQALSLKQAPTTSGNKCMSRSDIKSLAQHGLYMKRVDVSKTKDERIYRISGLLPANAPILGRGSVLSGESKKNGKRDDYVHYVALFDACDEIVIEQLEPRD